MNIKLALSILAIGLATLTGCASVPMESKEQDSAAKQFVAPEGEMSGVYIFRNSNFGAALKKLYSSATTSRWALLLALPTLNKSVRQKERTAFLNAHALHHFQNRYKLTGTFMLIS
jgi:starvation-inducible outer membrane lipoprotein